MHNYAKSKMFCIFELNEIKSKNMTLPPSEFATTHRQQPRKVLRKKRPNALISKQKIENEMTRTFSKKIKLKKHLQSETEVYTDFRIIQEYSKIIQTHPATLNLPQNGKTQGIRDCLQKIHIYTGLLQENPCVHATVKAKLAYKKKNR